MLHDTTAGWAPGIHTGCLHSSHVMTRIMTTRTTRPMGVWPVALSDEEQRLLEQMVAALAA